MGPLGEAAVSSRDDALAADEAGEAHELLGHRLGVLDHRRGVGDDAGDEHLALGQADVLPYAPLVGVAGSGRLDRVGLGPDAQHEIDDVAQAEVVEVRSLPASPTEVVAHAVLGDARPGRG